jgi:hypothetical protein
MPRVASWVAPLVHELFAAQPYTAPVAGMNCHKPIAPAGDLARGSKPLSIMATQMRSSGRRRSRSSAWIMSW